MSVKPCRRKWKATMTDRQRFNNQMHYRQVDRCFNMEFGYWNENFTVWPLFRQNGITELFPTGSGIAPFDFNHDWSSQNGIGSVYPFTVAQYGNTGVFISFEDIYQISSGSLKAIGGGTRDAILADLALSRGNPYASIDRGFQLGYSYPVYHLRIPIGEHTRSYLYSFDDDNWTRWTTSGVWPTAPSNECWI